MEALGYSSKNTDLTSTVEETALAKIFNKWLENKTDSITNIQLSKPHFEKIMEAYGINSANNEDEKKNQAQLLICLSAIFARYSSSKFFGTETDSPLPLRNYALALLNKAIELDSTIVDATKYLQDNANNWKYKFLKINGAFDCTAALSEIMIKEIKTKIPNILNTILPPAWEG